MQIGAGAIRIVAWRVLTSEGALWARRLAIRGRRPIFACGEKEGKYK